VKVLSAQLWQYGKGGGRSIVYPAAYTLLRKNVVDDDPIDENVMDADYSDFERWKQKKTRDVGGKIQRQGLIVGYGLMISEGKFFFKRKSAHF
jgi:hypothetical protein